VGGGARKEGGQVSVLTGTRGMSGEEWLEWRRKGIGSSDAAAILGLDPWRSPIMVYMDKLGLLPDQEEENDAIEAGIRLEPVVADWFAERTGYRIERDLKIRRHKQFDFMIANLDRRIVGVAGRKGQGVLEIKTTGEFNREEWEDHQAPFRALIQVQHQLAVTGFHWGVLCALVGGNKLRWVEVQRDDDVINDYLIPAEAAFWERVVLRDPPEWSGLDSEIKLLKRMYPQAEPGKEILLPDQAREWQRQYHEAHEAMTRAEARKTAAGNALREALGDAEVGYLDGEVIATYKTINAQRFDQKGFQEAHPGLFAEWKRPAPYRRLDVKKGA